MAFHGNFLVHFLQQGIAPGRPHLICVAGHQARHQRLMHQGAADVLSMAAMLS